LDASKKKNREEIIKFFGDHGHRISGEVMTCLVINHHLLSLSPVYAKERERERETEIERDRDPYIPLMLEGPNSNRIMQFVIMVILVERRRWSKPIARWGYWAPGIGSNSSFKL
jgi:hypothetical protein